MSILPSILEVANTYGLLRYKNPTSRGEIRVCCPFCGDDRKYHCYLNVKKNIFHCFRCGEQGGVARFIAHLEQRGEQEVIDRYREQYHRQRNQPRRNRHPALKLASTQWKRMGFRRKVDAKNLVMRRAYAQRMLDFVWEEWLSFKQQKLREAFQFYLLGRYTNRLKRAEETVRELEKETGIESLWEACERMYADPRDTWVDWHYESVRFVAEILASTFEKGRDTR